MLTYIIITLSLICIENIKNKNDSLNEHYSSLIDTNLSPMAITRSMANNQTNTNYRSQIQTRSQTRSQTQAQSQPNISPKVMNIVNRIYLFLPTM